MKTVLLGVAAAAMSLTAAAASAQIYGGGHNPYYSNSYSRSYDHGDYGHSYSRDNHGWYGGRSYGYDRGHRYDRHDYGYDRDNGTGTALAAGVIGLMLGTVLADHGNSYQQSYPYQQPYAYQPYGHQSYGYSPYGYGY